MRKLTNHRPIQLFPLLVLLTLRGNLSEVNKLTNNSKYVFPVNSLYNTYTLPTTLHFYYNKILSQLPLISIILNDLIKCTKHIIKYLMINVISILRLLFQYLLNCSSATQIIRFLVIFYSSETDGLCQ